MCKHACSIFLFHQQQNQFIKSISIKKLYRNKVFKIYFFKAKRGFLTQSVQLKLYSVFLGRIQRKKKDSETSQWKRSYALGLVVEKMKCSLEFQIPHKQYSIIASISLSSCDVDPWIPLASSSKELGGIP